MLTARLDRMGGAKEVAQIASVIGNEFSARLLGDVAEIAEERLNAELKKLAETELLFEQGDSPSSTYRFKHALIQDAAYQSLVRNRRQHYHRKIAETLKERFSDVAETQPEILAHHYASADMQEAAILYLKAAAEKSMRRSGTRKLSPTSRKRRSCSSLCRRPRTFSTGSRAPARVGHSPHRDQGFRVSDVGRVYARAREICQQAGQAPQLFPVLWGLWVFTRRAPSTAPRVSWRSNAGAWPTPPTTTISSCWLIMP